MTENHRFRPRHRLRRSQDFRQTFQHRCSVANAQVVVYVRANGLPHARLGLAVSRRVGKANIRNRWKRKIREVFRLRLAREAAGFDLIVVPRPNARLANAQLPQQLPLLARQAMRKWEDRKRTSDSKPDQQE